MSLGKMIQRLRMKRVDMRAYQEGEDAHDEAQNELVAEIGFEHGRKGVEAEEGFEEALEASQDPDQVEAMFEEMQADDDGDDD